MKNVLILSATASAVNYINSLQNSSEVKIFLTDASPYAAGLYAKNVTPFIVPRARKLEEYQKALDKIIKDNNIDILIPTSDHDMEGVAELLFRGWKPPVSMFKPNYETYRILTNKMELIKKLDQLGFEVPKIYNENELDNITFPAVIKPLREGGSKGVWILDNREKLLERAKLIKQVYGEVVIQEYIPGTTGSIYVALLLYGSDGKIYGEAASHSHLTFMTWGGGGNAGIVVQEPELLAQAKAIVSSLGGWQGPINLEFKRHEINQRFYLMEANCRLNGYSYLTSMNGLNFPQAVIDLLIVGKTEFLSLPPKNEYKNFIMSFREQPVDSWLQKNS